MSFGFREGMSQSCFSESRGFVLEKALARHPRTQVVGHLNSMSGPSPSLSQTLTKSPRPWASVEPVLLVVMCSFPRCLAEQLCASHRGVTCWTLTQVTSDVGWWEECHLWARKPGL